MMDKVARARKWYEEGQILFRRGEHESSARAFTHAMKAGWDPLIAHLSRGVANLLAGHHERAVDDFTAVLERDGKHERGLFYRGTAHLAGHDYRRALEDFERVLAVDPDHGAAHLSRGVCHAHLGSYEEAAADIKRAVMAAETDAQHFADSVGLWRNHLEGAMGVLHQHTDLSEEEMAKLRRFFED